MFFKLVSDELIFVLVMVIIVFFNFWLFSNFLSDLYWILVCWVLLFLFVLFNDYWYGYCEFIERVWYFWIGLINLVLGSVWICFVVILFWVDDVLKFFLLLLFNWIINILLKEVVDCFNGLIDLMFVDFDCVFVLNDLVFVLFFNLII